MAHKFYNFMFCTQLLFNLAVWVNCCAASIMTLIQTFISCCSISKKLNIYEHLSVYALPFDWTIMVDRVYRSYNNCEHRFGHSHGLCFTLITPLSWFCAKMQLYLIILATSFATLHYHLWLKMHYKNFLFIYSPTKNIFFPLSMKRVKSP